MDLPELLTPERIRCQCNVQSKKRALQTLSEILSESLLAPEPAPEPDDVPESESESGSNGTISSIASRLRNSLAKNEEDPEKGTVSEMGILDAFISRERLGSTCLDHGFALPHSRIACIDKPVAALITLKDGIDFNAPDKPPVDLVLGLLVPEESNDEHLKILASMARRFSDAQFRKDIRGISDPIKLYDYLNNMQPL